MSFIPFEPSTLNLPLPTVPSLRTLYEGSDTTNSTFLLRSFPMSRSCFSDKTSEVHVVNGGHESHLFDRSVQCSLSLFALCRIRGALALIHDIFLFHLLGAYTGPCFQRRLLLFPLFQPCFHIYRALLLRHKSLHTQFELSLSSCREQRRPSSMRYC